MHTKSHITTLLLHGCVFESYWKTILIISPLNPQRYGVDTEAPGSTSGTENRDGSFWAWLYTVSAPKRSTLQQQMHSLSDNRQEHDGNLPKL